MKSRLRRRKAHFFQATAMLDADKLGPERMIDPRGEQVFPKWRAAVLRHPSQAIARAAQKCQPTGAVRAVEVDDRVKFFAAQAVDELNIFAQRRMAWISRVTPNAVHPWRAIQQRGDVFGNGAVQFRVGMRLPHHPQRRQQVNGVTQEAEIQNHDLFRISRLFKKICGVHAT
ncbi:MAG TPA: hypothetical protein VMD27_07040 [Candidatus Aquilonibacter sp.]|nr:hypothetical protein [Candidatus Aquilonibacter sp.]